VATEQQRASLKRGEPWAKATHQLAGGTPCPISASDALPAGGELRLTYLLPPRPTPSTLVQYSLHLGSVAHREVAMRLWQRARTEGGEEWSLVRIDGRPFDADAMLESSELPSSGTLLLECYAGGGVCFEARYELDLADEGMAAIAGHLLGRANGREASAAQESIQKASINGHLLSATAVAEFRQALDADAAPSVRADVLARGTLCFTYVCRHPLHVCTRHFVLDLSRMDDGAVAAALCVWASAVPGETIVSQLLDGEVFSPPIDAEAPAAHLPKEGILEFDYVVVSPVGFFPAQPAASGLGMPPTLRPQQPIEGVAARPAPSLGRAYTRPEGHRLQSQHPLDSVVADRLAQLAYMYPDDPWLPAVLPLPLLPDGDAAP